MQSPLLVAAEVCVEDAPLEKRSLAPGLQEACGKAHASLPSRPRPVCERSSLRIYVVLSNIQSNKKVPEMPNSAAAF